MSDSLVIYEIYLSIQGESTFAGLPCVFIRLTGCNLRCSFCDTAYAFIEGKRLAYTESVDAVQKLREPFAAQAARQRLPLVEITGGEPLLQRGAIPLMKELCERGLTVLIETSGAHDISQI